MDGATGNKDPEVGYETLTGLLKSRLAACVPACKSVLVGSRGRVLGLLAVLGASTAVGAFVAIRRRRGSRRVERVAARAAPRRGELRSWLGRGNRLELLIITAQLLREPLFRRLLVGLARRRAGRRSDPAAAV